ncbi:MAG: type II toxin-antitoxin system RelE/ParE family toxin [Thermodesulfobacteriota bacterium]
MKYRVVVEKRVGKEALKIPSRHRASIDKAVLSLASDPRPRNCKKLTDREGYRVRVGDYRILYVVDDEARTVVIYRIKRRGERTYK